MADWNEPVFCSMNDIRVAIDMSNPSVGAKMKAHHVSDGEKGNESFNDLYKTVIWRIEDEITRFVL